MVLKEQDLPKEKWGEITSGLSGSLSLLWFYKLLPWEVFNPYHGQHAHSLPCASSVPFQKISLCFQVHDFTIASLHGSVLHLKCEIFAGSLYIQYSVWHIAWTPCMPQKCSPISQQQKITGRLYISGTVKKGGPGCRGSEWVIPRCASVVWGFFWTKGNQDAAGSRENSAPSYLPRRV